jgi:hypothetical protein
VSVPLRIARGLPLPSLHKFPQFPTDTIARSGAAGRGAVYTQLDCAWGELFVRNQQPQFFRPAF